MPRALNMAELFGSGGLAWAPAWDPGAGRIVPHLRCPAGHAGPLRTHDVAQDGTVSPSVVCTAGCDFHEHVVLEGWNPNWRPET